MSAARRAALSGMSAALAAAGIALGGALPTLQLSLYAFLSFPPAVLAAESLPFLGLLSAAAGSILGFFLTPDKLGVIPYVLFFGWYGAVYVSLACRMKPWAALAVKWALFNVSLGAGLLLARLFALDLGFPWWAFLLAGQPLFLLYDRVLGLFLGYYARRLRRYVAGGGP